MTCFIGACSSGGIHSGAIIFVCISKGCLALFDQNYSQKFLGQMPISSVDHVFCYP